MQSTNHPVEENTPRPSKFKVWLNESKVGKWLKRLGLAGFLFFFIKGLVWLVILFVVPMLAGQAVCNKSAEQESTTPASNQPNTEYVVPRSQ